MALVGSTDRLTAKIRYKGQDRKTATHIRINASTFVFGFFDGDGPRSFKMVEVKFTRDEHLPFYPARCASISTEDEFDFEVWDAAGDDDGDIDVWHIDEQEGGEVVAEAEGLVLHRSSRSSTGYKGVTIRSGRYYAQRRVDGKQVSLGVFNSAVDAAVAYARAVEAARVAELAAEAARLVELAAEAEAARLAELAAEAEAEAKAAAAEAEAAEDALKNAEAAQAKDRAAFLKAEAAQTRSEAAIEEAKAALEETTAALSGAKSACEGSDTALEKAKALMEERRAASAASRAKADEDRKAAESAGARAPRKRPMGEGVGETSAKSQKLDASEGTSEEELTVRTQAQQLEEEAARTADASTSSALQMQIDLGVHLEQVQQILAEAFAALNRNASGNVAATEAAKSALAEAFAARKKVEDWYADNYNAIQAENSKLEEKLREVDEATRTVITGSECMSRATYARHLRLLLGKDAIDGQDVFHIIANSKGGADHPDNFLYALGTTFNRSIGDNYDDLNAFLAGKEKTERAVRASIKYGNRTDPRGKPAKTYNPIKAGGSSSDPADEAQRLFDKGQRLMTHIRAARRGGEH